MFMILLVWIFRLMLCSCLMFVVLIMCRLWIFSIGVLGWVGVLLMCSRILWFIISLVRCVGLVCVVWIEVIILLCCMMLILLVIFMILCSLWVIRMMVFFLFCSLCRMWNRWLVLVGVRMLVGLFRIRILV